jgi:hypothetical protein
MGFKDSVAHQTSNGNEDGLIPFFLQWDFVRKSQAESKSNLWNGAQGRN